PGHLPANGTGLVAHQDTRVRNANARATTLSTV
ncbi:MAG: hypothetical protein QOE43_1654, partial [Gaiellaceae bacterium]|nr:hypothetical protein [Gaiellaceae bacterium]